MVADVPPSRPSGVPAWPSDALPLHTQVRRGAHGQHTAAHPLRTTWHACTALLLLQLGGTELARAAAWTGLGSQPSTLCSPHVSLLHPRIAATTAVPLMRRISPVSTVGLLLNVGLAPRSSTLCSSRVQLHDASNCSRQLHGYGRTGPGGRPGHAGAA